MVFPEVQVVVQVVPGTQVGGTMTLKIQAKSVTITVYTFTWQVSNAYIYTRVLISNCVEGINIFA